MFNALVVSKEHGEQRVACESWREAQLPAKEVLVAVEYSSLNFKDGLAVTGKGKILRSYPMIPGIDLAGQVRESSSAVFQPGDQVVLTGAGLGEDYCGGYAERAKVDAAPLIKLPTGMTTRQAMAAGTAGFTAALATAALQDAGVTPDNGPVVISGAAGGLGSIAIALLAKLGYSVTAITGREASHDYLRSLGATTIINRTQMSGPTRPLESQRWAGAIDNVGGSILANIIAQTKAKGVIASCGLAASHTLPTTVMPFILRAIKLIGINSTLVSKTHRLRMWEMLATLLEPAFWDDISHTIHLTQVPEYAEKIIHAEIQGRVIVAIGTH